MSHLPGERDDDLHYDNGEHIGTAWSTNGRDLERHEARIRAHLAAHRQAENVAKRRRPGQPLRDIMREIYEADYERHKGLGCFPTGEGG